MRWKILILLGTLLPGVTVTHAQYTYQPFVKEGKIWNMLGELSISDRIHNFQYLMQGDTVIGGGMMKKVHAIDEVHFHDNSQHYIGAVKEEDGRIYITYDGEDTPMLLYDFNLGPSSLLNYDENCTYKIRRTYLSLFNSAFRHFQMAIMQYPPEVVEIIPFTFVDYEGIGSVMGMDPFQYKLRGDNVVLTCYEDGACIYNMGDIDTFPAVEPTYAALFKNHRGWDSHDVISGKEVIQKVLGDTIIFYDDLLVSEGNGNLYHKVYCADSQKYGDTELHYYGAMREEGKKVWLVPDGKWGDDRELLFDFGLKKGDEAEVAGCTVKVVGSDSIISEGRKYRRLTLHQMEQGRDTRRTCHWTEGIGSDCGIVYPLPWDAADKSRLVVCDGDISIYDQSTVDLAVDNPYVEKRGMPTNNLYDLQGRRVTGQPRRGVYIQDGRKRVR